MHAVLLAMLLVLFTNASAEAQANASANTVLRGCKRYIERLPVSTGSDRLVDVAEREFCAGMVDGLFYVGRILPLENRFCSPGGNVTREQMVRVVVAYIERYPQRMHENFKGLALEALRDAWPCK